jgi:hypothetical protein
MQFNKFELYSRITLLFCSLFIGAQIVRYLVGLLFR